MNIIMKQHPRHKPYFFHNCKYFLVMEEMFIPGCAKSMYRGSSRFGAVGQAVDDIVTDAWGSTDLQAAAVSADMSAMGMMTKVCSILTEAFRNSDRVGGGRRPLLDSAARTFAACGCSLSYARLYFLGFLEVDGVQDPDLISVLLQGMAAFQIDRIFWSTTAYR